VTWRNITDGYLHSASVGAIALAPSDPDVLYVGTGEACPRNDVIAGDGLYRSIDGGRSFSHLGLAATRHISRVRVSPRDPDVVFVAALGDVFGPSEHRGVYRSVDGGAHFTQVLPGTAQAGAADLWMAPSNPRILYATLWEFLRQPWDARSGGPGSALYATTNGGEDWEDLTARPGLPRHDHPGVLLGRMGVAASPARPERLWVLIEAGEDLGGLYRSEDAGGHFERISDNKDLLGRPWYYSHIVPDPLDPDTLYAMNYDFWRSVDGGRTWTEIPTPHGDNHDLWIDPVDPSRMIEGNDGGACVSFNAGATFSTIYNQPTSAFYRLAIDDHSPYRVYGTQQDNSSIRVPSRSTHRAILRDDCEEVGHAESGDIVVDPRNDNIVYAGAVGSSGGGGAPLLRYDHGSGQTTLVTIWPEWTYAEDPSSWPHRFAWTFPLALSAHDPRVLYAGGECLFVTVDEGRSWQAISPDLTRNDREKLRAAGGEITKDTSGAELYCTLSVIAESPHDPDSLIVGTDDGLVHRTTDRGRTWERLEVPGLPEWATIAAIEWSRHDPGVIYLCAHRYRLQDRAAYVYRSSDAGASFSKITGGIADGDFARVIVEDPEQPGLCYLGTEHRVYASSDFGASFTPIALNLPDVPVYDLAVKGGDLVVATHGRGFHILDDGPSLLRELAREAAHATGADGTTGADGAPRTDQRVPGAGVLEDGTRLFVPPSVVRSSSGEGPAPKAPRTEYRGTATALLDRDRDGQVRVVAADAGTNPPAGLVVTYHLPEAVDPAELGLRVFDASGTELASFEVEQRTSGTPGEPGATGEPGPGTPAAPAITAGKGPLVPLKAKLDPSAGTHRLVFDLRIAGARLANPALAAMVGDDEDGAAPGPKLPPGTYRVELFVRGQCAERRVELVADPNVRLSPEAYLEQFELLREVRDRSVAVNEALRRCRAMLAATTALAERSDATDAVRTAAAAAREALGSLERRLTQPRWRNKNDEMEAPAGIDGRLVTLAQAIDAGDAAPTSQAREVAARLFAQADEILHDLEAVVGGPIAECNAAVASAAMPAVPLA
jgi:hypothetical protein